MCVCIYIILIHLFGPQAPAWEGESRRDLQFYALSAPADATAPVRAFGTRDCASWMYLYIYIVCGSMRARLQQNSLYKRPPLRYTAAEYPTVFIKYYHIYMYICVCVCVCV